MQEFLARTGVRTKDVTDARKAGLGRPEALELARAAKELYSARGSKIVHVTRIDELGDEELAQLLLGPTGNLRAPTMKVGNALVVGFNEDLYNKVLQPGLVQAR